MTLIPPPQYDFPPTIPVTEYVLSYEEVNRICPKIVTGHVPGTLYNGCAFVLFGYPTDKFSLEKKSCTIWRIDNKDTARHERAHCNGWDHEKR